MEAYNLKVVSDFKDYYDYLCNDKGKVVYERRSTKNKYEAYNLIKGCGINAAEVKPVHEFSCFDNELLVYAENGDILHMGVVEAMSKYPNSPAMKFRRSKDGYIYKFISIGALKYWIYIKGTYGKSSGETVKVESLSPEYTPQIPIPIYSIDYINFNSKLLAVDFHDTENLEKLGMSKYLTPQSVVMEVYKAIIMYNTI